MGIAHLVYQLFFNRRNNDPATGAAQVPEQGPIELAQADPETRSEHFPQPNHADGGNHRPGEDGRADVFHPGREEAEQADHQAHACERFERCHKVLQVKPVAAKRGNTERYLDLV